MPRLPGPRSTFEIRSARSSDIDGLLDMEALFPSDRLTRRDFVRELSSSKSLVLVAESEDTPIGYLLAHRKAHLGAIRLFSLIVSTETRKSGVGSTLLEALERISKSEGLRSVYLEVRGSDENAMRFYLNKGFKRSGKYYRFYSDGEDAIRMRKLMDT